MFSYSFKTKQVGLDEIIWPIGTSQSDAEIEVVSSIRYDCICFSTFILRSTHLTCLLSFFYLICYK
ncbi:hypothetical protein Hanom_Chr13g01184661 [Helianthus anomalus]